MRRGLVVGCGGTLGFAWTVATLVELEQQLGWDVRTADVLVGTSAGAEIVAALGSDRSAAQLNAALSGTDDADPVLARHLLVHPGRIPPAPRLKWPGLGLTRAAVRRRADLGAALLGLLPEGRGDAQFLRDFGAALTDGQRWVAHPSTWLIATDVRSGDRVAFGAAGSAETDIGSAIAASWAIPGWFPPVEINGRCYLDGGTSSPTSADLLIPRGLDQVIVVAPMATRGGAPATGLSRAERIVRRRMTRVLDAEESALRAAGTEVIRVEPGAAELAVMGFNFMDVARRADTLELARRSAPERVAAAIRRGQAHRAA